jgi:hypothetical protein
MPVRTVWFSVLWRVGRQLQQHTQIFVFHQITFRQMYRIHAGILTGASPGNA